MEMVEFVIYERYPRDLILLDNLNEKTVLDVIKHRYERNKIYTRCGDVLISVNPFKEIPIFGKKEHADHHWRTMDPRGEPHIFSVAAVAFQRLQDSHTNQVVLVSGESGAGKTENTKLMVKHLMQMCGHSTGELHNKIVQVNPLLEAFGNAKTLLNDNSSRFAKFLELSFDENSSVQGAIIRDYMLEKSRVVAQAQGEGNFHIFYSFLAGATSMDKSSLFINHSSQFRIAQYPPKDKAEYQRDYAEQMRVLKMLGMGPEEVDNMQAILAAILHLTNIQFESANQYGESVVKSENVTSLHLAARLLAVNAETFAKVLVIKKMVVVGEEIDTFKSIEQADEGRDALAKALYERLFGWLVRRINECLHPSRNAAATTGTIGILDICGFEILQKNSFEQMCINLVNEKLQSYMNNQIFKREQELYEEEGIQWTTLKYAHNDDIVEMFTAKGKGILDHIDEDTRLQHATDESLVRKLTKFHGETGLYIAARGDRPEFTITHFARKVKYDARGFLEKNSDTIGEDMTDCMVKSSNDLFSDLFKVKRGPTGTISATPYNYRASKRPSRNSSIPEENLTKTVVKELRKSLKKRFGSHIPHGQNILAAPKDHKTVISYFKSSMEELLQKMNSSEPRFVRCIKPNGNLAPEYFDDTMVFEQLSYNGIAEVARIRQLGYPVRRSYTEFLQRYAELAPESKQISDKGKAVHVIFQAVSAAEVDFRLGKRRVFLKEHLIVLLDTVLSMRHKHAERRQRKYFVRWKEYKRAKLVKKTDSNFSVTKSPDEKPPASKPAVTFGLTTIKEIPGSSYSSSESSRPSVPEPDPILPCPQYQPDEVQELEHSASENIAPAWDIFRIVDRELKTSDVHDQNILKIIKVIVYVVLNFVLLVSCVMQKVSLMTLVANIPGSDEKWKELDLDHKKRAKANTCLVLLALAVCIPYVLTSVLAFSKWLFGTFPRPSTGTVLWIFIVETFHSVGLGLLLFRVLPNLGSLHGTLVMSAVCIIPAILKLLCSSDKVKTTKSGIICRNSLFCKVTARMFDIFAILMQISVIPLILYKADILQKGVETYTTTDTLTLLSLVGAFVFVSVGWWENFVDDRLGVKVKDANAFKNFLLKRRFELQEGRYGLIMFTSLWKIIVTLVQAYFYRDGRVSFDYKAVLNYLDDSKDDITVISSIIILTITGFICYYIGYIACKLKMQIISFSIPLLLSTPITFMVLYLDCEFNFMNYVVGELQNKNCELSGETEWWFYVGAFVWFVSLMWVTRHVWFPRQERLAKFERMFINPLYCGILTTENLLLNRRRHMRGVKEKTRDKADNTQLILYYLSSSEKREDYEESESESQVAGDQDLDAEVPMIYACATMWHENKLEMTQLLKSLHRLDLEQWNRNQAMKISGVNDPDFFNYEAHIFFDDAMEQNDDDEWIANGFVKMLVSLITEACSAVHERPMNPKPPFKIPTPYGAQLVWEMPGENLLYVHVKDKNRIRHRKRWSQVMYMYYLLGYRLTRESEDEVLRMAQGDSRWSKIKIFDKLDEELQIKSENTFILALDGDTDFTPGAVRLLLDRMRKGNKVGAACGRIHPIGSGPLVWYQKFEYAVGHWLQKATEHVLGCVLCSPGCFSLFRGSALMDDNIMRKYTILPTEPGHYLQYDQGEDRWLCTLLLQQGYRVDYAAASDAYTYAPEGFDEFFNQRRRWMPSTLANIMDLLADYQTTVAINSNISMLYIVYQMAIMAGTVLGPGTVIMMIAGSINTVFKLGLIYSYIIALLPPGLYFFSCFWTTTKTQLTVGAILSTAYAFIMMVVLLGTIITAIQESLFHPSVIFIVALIAFFVITGLFHIKEIYCLPHGFLYLLCIPSGYLLLVIYSLCNLNIVSWGTRETPKRKSKAELEAEAKAEEEKKKKEKEGLFSRLFFRSSYIKEMKELITSIRPGGDGDKDVEKAEDRILKELQDMNTNLKMFVSNVKETHNPDTVTGDAVTTKRDEREETEVNIVLEKLPSESLKDAQPANVSTAVGTEWLNDPDLGNGEILSQNPQEREFWERFIERYLKPLNKDAKKEEETKMALINLRNNVCFALAMLNLLWIAINFMFQYRQPTIIRINYTFNGKEDVLEVELLGLLFIAFFLSIIIIQFIGMVIHRWGTLQHLVSITELRRKKTKKVYDEETLKQAQDFCTRFNLEPLPDYLEEDLESSQKNLKEAIESGRANRNLQKSQRRSILEHSTRNNDFGKLISSSRIGMDRYLKGCRDRHRRTETRENDFVSNLRQSMVSGGFQPRRSNGQSQRPSQGILRHRHLHQTLHHLVDSVKRRGIIVETDEEPSAERVSNEFGEGTLGRAFARKMHHLLEAQKTDRMNQRMLNGEIDI